MNITPSFPHPHTYLCSAGFIVNITHQHDNDKIFQAIYCYARCLVGLLVITYEAGQRAACGLRGTGWPPLLYRINKKQQEDFQKSIQCFQYRCDTKNINKSNLRFDQSANICRTFWGFGTNYYSSTVLLYHCKHFDLLRVLIKPQPTVCRQVRTNILSKCILLLGICILVAECSVSVTVFCPSYLSGHTHDELNQSFSCLLLWLLSDKYPLPTWSGQ